MNCQKFEAVVNHNEEFKAIAAYLLITSNPSYKGVNEYVRELLQKPNFKLWSTLTDYERTNRAEGYNNLEGFFAFLGVSNMESFIHDLEGQKIWELFSRYGNGMLRIYRGGTCITHRWTNNYATLRLDNPDGTYNLYDTRQFHDLCQVKSCILLDFERIDINIMGTWQTGVVKTGNTYLYSEYFNYNR